MHNIADVRRCMAGLGGGPVDRRAKGDSHGGEQGRPAWLCEVLNYWKGTPLPDYRKDQRRNDDGRGIAGRTRHGRIRPGRCWAGRRGQQPVGSADIPVTVVTGNCAGRPTDCPLPRATSRRSLTVSYSLS